MLDNTPSSVDNRYTQFTLHALDPREQRKIRKMVPVGDSFSDFPLFLHRDFPYKLIWYLLHYTTAVFGRIFAVYKLFYDHSLHDRTLLWPRNRPPPRAY
jgi:hypothetical protein